MLRKNIFNFLLIAFILVNNGKAVYAQYATDYSFEAYKIKDGLSIGTNYTIYQDKLGYIWVGNIGIERFDGYSFKNYRSSVIDSNALKTGNKYEIKEATNGDLWVANSRYLSYLNRRTDVWKNYNNIKFTGSFYDIVIDEPNQQVFATNNGFGLVSFNYKNNTWDQFQMVKDTSGKKNSANLFRKIIKLDATHLLLTTNNGLLLFNTQTKKFEKEYLKSADPLKAIGFFKFTQN